MLPSTRAQNTWGRLRDSSEYPPPATLALSLPSTSSYNNNDNISNDNNNDESNISSNNDNDNTNNEDGQHSRLYLQIGQSVFKSLHAAV